jgi:glycogen debranching enzyme
MSAAAAYNPPLGFHALKHDHMFAVADALGDMQGSSDGLFHNDTRILSRYVLTVGGATPALLSSGLSTDNVFFRANLTNRPLPLLGESTVTPQGAVHIERSRLIWQGQLHERLAITNYGDTEFALLLELAFAADFADIFEVRGLSRPRRGNQLPAVVGRACVQLGYEALDGAPLVCMMAFSPEPVEIGADHARFEVLLPRRAGRELYIEVGASATNAAAGQRRYRAAAAQARRHMRAKRSRGARLRTASPRFDRWLARSRADLALLETSLETGPYPFAGIPWFSTPFGRDALITALQVLWLDPDLARGVLAFLARHQAAQTSETADSQPGKILHEMRGGEMARLGEVPFARYYGSADSTPLFVMLAGAYARRTGDLEFIAQLWPALLRAMKWIDGPADSNRDGLVDYSRATELGLVNQGWKDSFDSVFHEDGRLPIGPIALVEVQGYVYAANGAMAELAELRGDLPRARHWRRAAERVRRAVESRYWMPDQKFYGIALDGTGALCRVCASNAGHLLFVGLPSARRARHVCEQLQSGAFDSGWGTRTVREHSVRFNPMSYHNGTVWPHDTGLCAAGMARYGRRAAARRLLEESFSAAAYFDMRLPELLCGFARRTGEPPVGYPVACLPQAWSSGAAFMMLQATLGVEVDGLRREIVIDRPDLPRDIERLEIERLPVAGGTVDLRFRRRAGKVGVQVAQATSAPIRLSIAEA